MIRHLLFAAALCCGTTGAKAQDISEGLVHHLTFSDRDRPGLDSVTLAEVMTGSTAWYPTFDRFGVFPAARTLDRSGHLEARRNRFVREAHADFSLSYWLRVLRFVDATQPLYLFDNRTDGQGTGLFARYLPGEGRVEYGEEGAVQTVALVLDTVAWVHVAFVEDRTGGARRLYLNGEALTLGGADYRPVTGTSADHPRFRVLASTERSIPFSGSLRLVDDVRLHDRVVTAATVGAMYATRDSVPPQPTSGPVTFVPPFPDGFVQTRWPVADDDHVVREYRVTVNDSTWTTTTQGNFYNYRYEADSTYALSLRSVDYSGNVGAGAYDTVFVWPRATAVAEPTWAGALTLAPNPVGAGGRLTLGGLPAEGIRGEGVRAELFAIDGRRIGWLGISDGSVRVPPARAGVYVLRLTDASGAQASRRLVIGE